MIAGPGGRTCEYDAESRIKTVKNNAATVATYLYDGDGRRIKKVAGGETRWYFHDPAGRAVWEYKQGATYPWDTFNFHFNGKLTAVNSVADGLLWTHLDHLGTPRVKTDATGKVAIRLGQPDRDWQYPFGEQINAPVDGVRKRFTGQERDPESGLDYFGARHYAPALGRFVSPDKPLIDQRRTNPQSWNLFSYARNNPLSFVDPNGRAVVVHDEKALQTIKNTLPKALRAAVVLDTSKNISVEELGKLNSANANLAALRRLAASSDVLDVKTSSSTVLGGKAFDFSFETMEDVKKQVAAAGGDPSYVDGPELFLGNFLTADESTSGNAMVVLADQTGQAASAPDIEIAVTAAHEIYGHAFLYFGKQPFEHDGGGEVDKQLREVEERTRRDYQ